MKITKKNKNKTLDETTISRIIKIISNNKNKNKDKDIIKLEVELRNTLNKDQINVLNEIDNLKDLQVIENYYKIYNFRVNCNLQCT
jgi:hypothetical protein